MKLNEKKFFELAKENNFEASDIYFHRNYSLAVSIYHGKVESFNTSDNSILTARGILNGKFGTVTTEVIDKNTPEFLVNSIKRTANCIENDDPSIIFKGSKKYHKKNYFNPAVLSNNTKDKVDILLRIEKALYDFDKRINEVICVGYEESLGEDKLSNSYGLKLSQKDASYCFYAQVSAKDGDEIRTGFKYFASLDENEFDEARFVKETAEDALNKLGSSQCKSKKYPVVFNPETASTLLKFLLSSIDAEEIQKHSSVFEGKLNTQIVSKKLSVMEDPLRKSVFFRYFDDEGVATNKKWLIKKGVLSTYLYTLRTAMIDNVEPTGNGFRGGGKASADTTLLVVKPGKISENDMISGIKEGVYITELEGLHAGMNAQSGNFSLQSGGFLIKDGKIDKPLSLITIAGNLFEMFNNIKNIASNSELVVRNACECPSIYIKKMAVSGVAFH